MSEQRLSDNAVTVFASELTRIDRIGNNRRLVFTVPATEGDGWKDVQVKVIVPADMMVTLLYMIAGDGEHAAESLLSATEPMGTA
jgi:hypothetical protein